MSENAAEKPVRGDMAHNQKGGAGSENERLEPAAADEVGRTRKPRSIRPTPSHDPKRSPSHFLPTLLLNGSIPRNAPRP